jgi:Gly-Xaa carboxypeptidase
MCKLVDIERRGADDDIWLMAWNIRYKYATVETINRFGLVYTIEGSKKDLAPILLTAHQDVVPVEEETLDRWEHPPFDAYWDEDGGYVWGRGTSDDKSAITP